MKIAIIDYGAGNLHNIVRLFTSLEHEVVVINSPSPISIDALILPGVGSYNFAMNTLDSLSLSSFILDHISTGKPFISICVGMQILSDFGDEGGKTNGLGLIPGEVKLLPKADNYRLPHIGWSRTKFKDSNLCKDAYYAHSYFFDASNPDHIIATSQFADFVFPAIINYKNITGIQFHPEISASFGSSYIKSLLS